MKVRSFHVFGRFRGKIRKNQGKLHKNRSQSGLEWWHNFYEFHKLAIDELEAFDYEEYKKNGFKVNKLGDYDLTLDFDKKPE